MVRRGERRVRRGFRDGTMGWTGWESGGRGEVFVVGFGFIQTFSFGFFVVELGLEDGFLILSDGLREPNVGELTTS